jgi:esterase/lipase superfamily enzyme
MSKTSTTWRSERLQREVKLVRWGTFGTPVLMFPTAGGDAEEIERMQMLIALGPLVEAGKIKVYSCDSVAGRAMLVQEGTAQHRMWVQNMFQQYVRHEVVPAIRMDCQDENLEIVVSGASIGAFHAVAVLCRWPNVFSKCLAVSGTYKLERFLKAEHYTQDFAVSSPHLFVPTLSGHHLDVLRARFILFCSGEGRAEDIGESWSMARILGDKGIPNRVDSWGPDWPHDWQTWRKMVPQYLGEWTQTT